MALPDRLSEPPTGEDWLSWWRPEDASDRYPRADDQRVRARQESRRRMRLIRRRRLDMLQDATLALVLAVFVLLESAGLGVVALLAAVTALALVASLVIEKRRRRASDGARPASASRRTRQRRGRR
jgi:hypothetical protein